MNEYHLNQVPERVPFKVVFASMAGLWLCYFVLVTLRGNVVGLGMEGELLWRRAVVSLAGLAVTYVLWLVIRLFEVRSLAVKIAVVLIAALPASVLIAQANHLMFASIQEEVTQKMGEENGVSIYRDEAGNLLLDIPRMPVEEGAGPELIDPRKAAPDAPTAATVLVMPASTALSHWRYIVNIALSRYFLLLAWAALYLALLAGAQARAAERREQEFRNAAKAAELRSLRYQVNPHFLFNTLNSLSALVMTGKADRAEQMIQTISRFYRHSLSDDTAMDVALEDEFDLQELYLAIESVRFPKRLRTHIALPPPLACYRVPGMILQPLVENSVKYGVSASREPVTITVAAREEYGRLVLTVSDDGPGAASGMANGFGIGLANVRDRLVARFGTEASITSGPTLGGYETELRMPLVKHG